MHHFGTVRSSISLGNSLQGDPHLKYAAVLRGRREGQSGCSPEPAGVTVKYSCGGEGSVAGREDMEDQGKRNRAADC